MALSGRDLNVEVPYRHCQVGMQVNKTSHKPGSWSIRQLPYFNLTAARSIRQPPDFTLVADFLKANSFVQSQCSDWKFCAKICVKKYREKTFKTRKRNCFKLLQINEIIAICSCFAFTSPKFGQILKYVVQSCDCMIAAFTNSVRWLPDRSGRRLILIRQPPDRKGTTVYCNGWYVGRISELVLPEPG